MMAELGLTGRRRLSRERYLTIDAVRGVAVLGILLMNIVGQGLPSYAYVSPAYWGGDTGANLTAWLLAYLFVDGKMRALFTLLYGASLLLIADAAEGRTPGPAATHYRRTVWLFLFGMLHAWFVWYGDILVTYALAGSIAFLARNWPPRRLIGAGAVVLGLLMAWGVMGHVHFAQMRAMAEAPGAAAALVEQWRVASAELAPPLEAGKAEVAGYLGGVVDAFHARMPMTLFFQTFLIPTQFMWEALGFILIGMGLYRMGFFTAGLAKRTYDSMVALVPAGVVVGWFLAEPLMASNWDPVLTLLTDALAIPLHLAMGLGYAAIVIATVRSHRLKPLVDRLAACGRMAFTNYLGANIITTTLFYGNGAGLFAQLERYQLYGVVAAVWALQLACSKPWLERFHYGPFEWAWRSLARWEVQPFVKGHGVSAQVV